MQLALFDDGTQAAALAERDRIREWQHRQCEAIRSALGISVEDARTAITEYGDIDTLISQALLGNVKPQHLARRAKERWRELAKWDESAGSVLISSN